jgi:hypothetical protein
VDSAPDYLIAALSKLPDLRVSRIASERGAPRAADFRIEIEIQRRRFRLMVKCVKNAYPRDVRSFIDQLWSWNGRAGDATILPMLASPSITEGSRELLRAKRIAYADSGGSVYLPVQTGVFFVERAVPRGAKRKSLNIFSGNTTRVLHTVLSDPGRQWHTVEIAAAAGVSPSTAHQVLEALEREQWARAIGAGPNRVRVLTEPGGLLDAWREEHTLRDYEVKKLFGSAKSAAALVVRLTSSMESAGVKYALTLSSGAALVVPSRAEVQEASVLVAGGAGANEALISAGLEPAEEGANVRAMMLQNDAPLLNRRELAGVWVASDVQLYLDLWSSGTRGKEQAESIRRERMRY